MEFEKAQIRIQPRSKMEALDLGVLIARRYWWRLVAGWLIVAVPVFVVTWFVPTLWALLALWWFKPLYERIPMSTVASSIFAEYTQWPSMRKNLLSPDCLLWLTLFRFFPGRSTLAPVAALEEHRFGSRRIHNRRALLKEDIQGAYLGLHCMGLLFEIAILVFFLLIAIWILSPIETDPGIAFGVAMNELSGFLFDSYWGPKIVLTATFTSFACVAPFYVCCGFALYLNRRIELEGWDLDLEFQRMVQRITPLLGILFLAVSSIASHGQPTEQVWSEEVQESQAVMASEIDEIVHSTRISRIEKRYGRSDPTPKPDSPVSNVLATFLTLLAWTLLLGGIVWIFVKIFTSDYVRAMIPKNKEEDVASKRNVRDFQKAMTLPKDVVAAAEKDWKAGRFRDAMSLLYRGALYSMVTKFKCDIDLSDTEASCMRVVYETTPELSDSFTVIARNWQLLAYANLSISDDEFRSLSNLYSENFKVDA